jgi:tripartite-type tricarboxylate transporter receptor subunit TctC
VKKRRGLRAAIGLVALACVHAGAALAQSYPARPIRMLNGFPPGSAPDVASRVLADKLAPVLGQPVVVENRVGSNGNIAGETLLRAPADGHTLMLCADSQIVINPHIYTRMPFDPLTDLVLVASVASNEFFLAVNPEAPYRTFQEFVDAAKKARPPLAYASGGNGSQHQLTMEMLKARLGIELTHVPYKGGGPAMLAIIAGEVPIGFAGSSAGPQVRAGKLRALAVAAPKRVTGFPDVPAVAEFVPGFSNSIWLALCAAKGTPDPILGRLRAEVNRLLAGAEVRSAFAKAGALEPFVTTPEELATLVRSDHEKYGRVVKSVGAKID